MQVNKIAFDATKNTSTINKKARPKNPATIHELRNTDTERIIRISNELISGFEFLNQYEKSVTFFGSARFAPEHPYAEKAREVSEKIVNELGYAVLSGGGPGIMEAANRGAREAGGDSLGITIKLPHEQTTNKYLTDNIDLYYFFVRKVCLAFSAEAFIFFPGGFGTLDEFFEILTLIQTNKIEQIPLICVGSEFWKPLESFFLKHLIELGTISASDLHLYHITDDHDEIIDLIKNHPLNKNVI
jgi:uncharacterized protein (TIGR00730 family)